MTIEDIEITETHNNDEKVETIHWFYGGTYFEMTNDELYINASIRIQLEFLQNIHNKYFSVEG